ncbi:bifunctional adenosylcobinamide kinase/adenosylcobinamide-phosphate guanylyltransferase [Halomonas cupida]|uniref:bifunctional adenosylcobinamide kinase/adenosylcobinamide-phosphate guanylyltransferase n=1 Tax=Halomonas cupida TaxID=44933 RepID=UPI003A8EBDE9
MIVFVSGGVRSGKSQAAEQLAEGLWLQRPGVERAGVKGTGAQQGDPSRSELTDGASRLCYLATAALGGGASAGDDERPDDEMCERIAHHRARRGDNWVTWEAPVDLLAAWRQIAPGDTVLLDCLTLWASQLMFASSLSEEEGLEMLQQLVTDARRRDIALVVVSNDINEDLPPTDALVRQYLAFLQTLHRDLAQRADRVIEVVAGCWIDWKTSNTVATTVSNGLRKC